MYVVRAVSKLHCGLDGVSLGGRMCRAPLRVLLRRATITSGRESVSLLSQHKGAWGKFGKQGRVIEQQIVERHTCICIAAHLQLPNRQHIIPSLVSIHNHIFLFVFGAE